MSGVSGNLVIRELMRRGDACVLLHRVNHTPECIPRDKALPNAVHDDDDTTR